MRKRTGITIVSLLVICTLVVAGMVCAQPADIEGHWAQEQIGKWLEEGLAGGYPDGTFKPNREVSRAEFVALTNRAFGMETEGFDADFSDVIAGQWYYNDIAAANAAGYVGGYPDGTFKPGQSISRQEAASILVRLLGLEPSTQGLESFKDATQIPEWSRSSIAALVSNGLMGGYPDGTFKPARSITRAEAVVVLDRARDFAPEVIETASLKGTVTLDGKPAGGAVVRVFEAGNYEVLQETETDSKGHYEFRLDAGDYDLTAVTDTGVAYLDDVELTRENDTTANLELQPAAVISGVLEDENGRKVKEARLLFTTNPTFVLLTDNYGKFTGAVLPDRTYIVRAYEPGKEDAEPVVVNEAVEIGSAGTRHVDTLTAPFSVGSTGGGGGGGGGSSTTSKPITAITLNKSTLELNVGESATLTANIEPTNYTGEIVWDSSDESVAKVDSEGNVTAVAAGTAIITVSSRDNSDIKDTCTVVVYQLIDELEKDNDGSLSADLPAGVPVKVKAQVEFEGKEPVELTLAIESTGEGNARLIINEPDQNIVPDDAEPFVGLDISLKSVPEGTPVRVELPCPENLESGKVGAFHYSDSSQVWEYREATVIDGKVVFSTNLSPVAVTRAVAVPVNLKAVYDSEIQAVNLTWDEINDAVYVLFRDDKPITSFFDDNAYTDENIAPGTYTYYVRAYETRGSAKNIKFESKKSVEATITVPEYIPLPVDHTLPAVLDAVEKAFLVLTDEQWEQLKSHRDKFLKNAQDEDITVEEIRESLEQANLLEPFERLINSDVTVEEARVTLNIIVSLSNLGRDNVNESLDIIREKVQELKNTYQDEIDRLLSQGVTQEAVYDYTVEVCESILNGDYTLRKEHYEEDLYDAALDVLRNNNHQSLEGVAQKAFERVKEYYVSREGSTIGNIIKELDPDFDDVDGNILLIIKNGAETIAKDKNLEDVKDLFNLLDFMLDTGEIFFPVQ